MWLCVAILLGLASSAQAQPDADELGLTLALFGEGGNHRSFRHFEPTTGEVRTYKARVYGGATGMLAYERPLSPQLSLSVQAEYFHSLAFSSGARRLGEAIGTTAQHLSAGVELWARLLSARKVPWLSLRIGAGGMRFGYDTPAPQSADDRQMQLATGDYDLLRAGVGMRLPIHALRLRTHADYLHGLRTGDFGGRSASQQPAGFDARVTLDYRVLSWLDVSLRGGLTLLLLRLSPLPLRPMDAEAELRDLYVAAGAGASAHF